MDERSTSEPMARGHSRRSILSSACRSTRIAVALDTPSLAAHSIRPNVETDEAASSVISYRTFSGTPAAFPTGKTLTPRCQEERLALVAAGRHDWLCGWLTRWSAARPSRIGLSSMTKEPRPIYRRCACRRHSEAYFSAGDAFFPLWNLDDAPARPLCRIGRTAADSRYARVRR